MHSFPQLVEVVAFAGGMCLLALIYFNASVNAHADREDAIVSVPDAQAGVDELGDVGFTGGVGIADAWSGAGDTPRHWRDTHARILGPAVASMQRAFVDSWNDATGELLLKPDYFPRLASQGDTTICIVQSNPANATSAAQRAVAALIASAQRSLVITNPYFVPTRAFVGALCGARARGVDVRILMPGPFHNRPIARAASCRTWRRLLEGGVRLFKHQRTMVHSKVIAVDDTMLCVGANQLRSALVCAERRVRGDRVRRKPRARSRALTHHPIVRCRMRVALTSSC